MWSMPPAPARNAFLSRPHAACGASLPTASSVPALCLDHEEVTPDRSYFANVGRATTLIKRLVVGLRLFEFSPAVREFVNPAPFRQSNSSLPDTLSLNHR